MSKNKIRALGAIIVTLATATAFTGCDSGGGGSSGPASLTSTGSTGSTGSPTLPGAPAPSSRSYTTDFMVFTGSGTWSTEISDAEALMTANAATYQEVSDAQLDAMTPADIAQFGVIFIPGGDGQTEADGVSAATHANLRTAVQSLGVSYVGFCAGAFVAVAPAPAAGQDVSYGFGVVNGAILNEYAGPGTNANYEQTLETFADGTTENILWYGGPITPNQGVVAKYPTGDPAISEMWSGNGFVIIAGLHPDLSQASLSSLGATPATSAQDTAWKIFSGALHQQPLPTF